jgi:hypothetical protein
LRDVVVGAVIYQNYFSSFLIVVYPWLEEVYSPSLLDDVFLSS